MIGHCILRCAIPACVLLVSCTARAQNLEGIGKKDPFSITGGLNACQLTTGAPARSDRIAKYNQLMRIEEMLELTHRSFVSYTLPTTGQVIPLLQITPSKTDKERLLVISPELAAVIAEIIHYVRNGSEQLPLVHRYDQHERLHSPARPFRVQRRWGDRAKNGHYRSRHNVLNKRLT